MLVKGVTVVGNSCWRHQTETFSALQAICVGNSPVPGEFPSQSQWRGALTYSLICTWINGWLNKRMAGDLRRNRAHYDVSVMISRPLGYIQKGGSNVVTLLLYTERWEHAMYLGLIKTPSYWLWDSHYKPETVVSSEQSKSQKGKLYLNF